MSNADALADPAHRRLGMHTPPFPPTPDAEHYFHTEWLQARQAEAAHCLASGKGFILLTGEIGTGKSTFLRQLLAALAERQALRTSLVFNTFLQGEALLAAILKDFGLPAHGSAADHVERLNAFLLEQWRAGALCVLCIDDAQNLSLESLELLRLLSNLESGQEKLLQIVLCGQPELAERLARPEIRQLTSRIGEHIRLHTLDRAETGRYAAFRLAVSGAAGRIDLAPRAVAALYRRSRGNARRIHQILDRALYGVLQQGHGRIDAALVRRAAAEAGMAHATAPRATRRARLPMAAAVLAAGVLGTGALYAAGPWRAAPTVPAAAPAQAAPAPAHAFDACLAALAAAGADAARLLWVSDAPAGVAALAQGRPGLCARERDGRTDLAWRAPWRPEDFASGGPHPSVQALQQRLGAAGLLATRADGIYGAQTRQALASFQRDHALPATGSPDPATLLLAALALPAEAPALIEEPVTHD
ncbi:AAA domain protein [Bordetella bronchiseptica SBL-F6116]|uniref:ExeA family protein n=6 Tax=Bordetella bronchiseptica TaxID=518 RepID=UPI000460B8CC|nr:ExeA family protein [Bordetella bronchiseptica]KDD18535.1 AAA domain protein [Bordetella bronchiseptica MBORD707]KDD96020.1 AAA domain protein [Bordetella bronchiseptica SBL-F6116]